MKNEKIYLRNKNVKMDADSFVIINFRGKECYIGQDMIKHFPYINSLVNGPMKGSQVSEKGHIIIDENSATLYMLNDMYRSWVQQDCPQVLNSDILTFTSTLWACAQRMGCEISFVDAIKPKNLINTSCKDEDLFRCVYCHQMKMLDAKKSKCSFHDISCVCRKGRSREMGCCTMPFHSQNIMKDSLTPMSFEEFCKWSK